MIKNILGLITSTITALVLVSILTSCYREDFNEYVVDFNKEGQELRVTVITYDSLEELNKLFGQMSEKKHQVNGFAEYSKVGNKCVIHVLKGKDQQAVWGHELAHCVYGNWHK